jgi:hypothetical protein
MAHVAKGLVHPESYITLKDTLKAADVMGWKSLRCQKRANVGSNSIRNNVFLTGSTESQVSSTSSPYLQCNIWSKTQQNSMYYFLISNSHKWWWSFLFAHDCLVQSGLYRVKLVQQRLLVQIMMLTHNELLRPDLCSTVEAPYNHAHFLSNLFHDGECWASISLITDLSNIMNLVADGSTELLTYSDWPFVPQVSEPWSVSCLKWTPIFAHWSTLLVS